MVYGAIGRLAPHCFEHTRPNYQWLPCPPPLLTEMRPLSLLKVLFGTEHPFSCHRGAVLRSVVSFDLIQPERERSAGQMDS